MDLLTPQERLDIRSVIHDVSDTFFVTPVIYYMYTGRFDRFGEGTNKGYTQYTLSALYEDDGSDIKKELNGLDINHGVKLTFNTEDLILQSLINAENQIIFNEANDYFIVKGKKYKVVKIQYDAPLDEQDLLVIIYGDIYTNKT